jgi:hypothetical protein
MGRRVLGSIPERRSLCDGQLWPFLYKYDGNSSFVFAYYIYRILCEKNVKHVTEDLIQALKV